jgi:hypothetical protein
VHIMYLFSLCFHSSKTDALRIRSVTANKHNKNKYFFVNNLLTQCTVTCQYKRSTFSRMPKIPLDFKRTPEAKVIY